MSNINMIDQKRIHGKIDRMSIDTNNPAGMSIDMIGTISSDHLWTDCIICKKFVSTNYRLFDEGICEECKGKVTQRLGFLINFE